MNIIPEATVSDFLSGQSSLPPEVIVTKALRAIRTHLQMDVAFVSEFLEGRRHFRQIDTRLHNCPIKIGDSDPLEESFCQRVVDGRLPELIHDATKVAAALKLPVTKALPVGAHMSVPIVLEDGRVYGTLCCFSHTPEYSLNHRDLAMMRVFADMAAEQIEIQLKLEQSRIEIQDRINGAINENAISMVFQPIYRIAEKALVGFESLARFSVEPIRTPDKWFIEASQVGLHARLESKAVEIALRGLHSLPDNVYVSVNVSPATIIDGQFQIPIDDMPLGRIVLEITEHATVEHYDAIAERLADYRRRGLRIAVDDAGAGYASFRHILSLQPDIIKLDMSITRNIDTDVSRRALAAALVGFSSAVGCKIVAEGVETEAELNVLRDLGITKAQGYFLGRPASLEVARSLLHH